MRTLVSLMIALAFSGWSGSSRIRDLSLTIRPVDSSIPVGAPVVVEARVANAGRHPLRLIVPLRWPNAYFMIEVRAPDGRALSSHIVGPHEETPMELRDAWETRIPAGGFVGRRIVLSSGVPTDQPRFDFAQPGVYRIVGSISVFDPDTRLGQPLVSDTMEVRIGS